MYIFSEREVSFDMAVPSSSVVTDDAPLGKFYKVL